MIGVTLSSLVLKTYPQIHRSHRLEPAARLGAQARGASLGEKNRLDETTVAVEVRLVVDQGAPQSPRRIP